MPEYVMLLWENPTAFASASPAEIEQIIKEYVAWREKMGAAGKITGGKKLRDEGGRHLRAGTVKEGPYAEVNEIVGGLFFIEAANYEEAVEIARSCPHLKFGWVEVREVEPT
ncbi:MAG: YciI family protein [Gemmatimonadales bacterium]